MVCAYVQVISTVSDSSVCAHIILDFHSSFNGFNSRIHACAYAWLIEFVRILKEIKRATYNKSDRKTANNFRLFKILQIFSFEICS